MKSLKSIDIFDEKTFDYSFLKDQENFLGHTNEDETLLKHSERALKVYNKLIDKYDLNKILNNFYNNLFEKSEKNLINLMEFKSFIKSLVYYHDLGKINPNFQLKKLKNNKINNLFKENIEQCKLDTDHSKYSSFVYFYLICNNKKINLNSEVEQKLFLKLLLISTVLHRHHSYLKDLYDFKEIINGNFSNFIDLKKLIINNKLFDINNLKIWSEKQTGSEEERFDFPFNLFNEIFPREKNQFKITLFYFYKLIYSLLTTSDIVASKYRDKIDIYFKESVFDKEKKKEFIKKLDLKINSFKNPSKKINQYRNDFSDNARDNLIKALDSKKDKRIHYLYMPTGSGKTITSLRLASTILEKDDSINRIRYVFPFINIIEQSHEEFCKILGKEMVSSIYSVSNYSPKDYEEKEETKDTKGVYLLNSSFINYPFSIISNVNFFNILLKASKKNNIKLTNFTNSVVILDEIQSLNKKHWPLYTFLLDNFAKNYNCHIIIMSATLPNLKKLLETNVKEDTDLNYEDIYTDLIEVNNNKKIKEAFKYFNERIDFDLIKDMSITSIHEKITEEINNHHNSFLIVVNTVNKSVDLYKSILKKSKLKKYFQNSEDDSRENIFLLNSTMLSSRRKELINIVKQKSKTNERTLIISTQSIEAGVDLDFDIGFRELAPIDSILQTAGRINRNYRSENKPYKLYISEQSKDINQVYRDDLDLLIDKEKNKKNKKTKIEMKDVFELLTGISNNNDFIDKLNKTGDRAYTDLTNEIINKMKDNRGKKLEFTEYDYINIVNNLRYLTLDKKIDVISSNGFSFYIKGQIPIKGLKKEEVDTFKEILKEFKDLISSLDINFNKLINEEYIDSNLFLELYKSVISTKDYSKEEKKIQLKKLNSILNCCLISVNINKRYLNSKMQYDDIIDMYILPLSKNKEDGLYSYSKGIDKEQLKKLSKNTLIF